MTDVVVDASIAVNWFAPEPGSKAMALLNDPTGRRIAPTLMQVECVSALCKKVRHGDFKPDLVADALRDLLDVGLEWLPDADLLRDATALALRHRHPIYDCLYLVAAQRNGAALATQDRGLAVLARTLSPPVPVWEG